MRASSALLRKNSYAVPEKRFVPDREAMFTWAPEVKEWTRECFEDEVAAIPFATRVVGPVAPIGGPVRA